MKTKKEEKPYQSNSMTDLKKEALVNGDVECLKKIKAAEQHSEKVRHLYVLENEDFIRDRNGIPVPFESLRFPYGTAGLHFVDLYFIGRCLSLIPDGPSDLHREINFTAKGGLADFILFEMPTGTEFPLPQEFGWSAWLEMCRALPENQKEDEIYQTYRGKRQDRDLFILNRRHRLAGNRRRLDKHIR